MSFGSIFGSYAIHHLEWPKNVFCRHVRDNSTRAFPVSKAVLPACCDVLRTQTNITISGSKVRRIVERQFTQINDGCSLISIAEKSFMDLHLFTRSEELSTVSAALYVSHCNVISHRIALRIIVFGPTPSVITQFFVEQP